ncbi:MAG: type I pullulanase [Chitinophagaceae bacterium]
MKHLLAIPIALLFLMQSSLAQKNTGALTYPVYTGTDMGYMYSKTNTRIRVYAPTAQELRLNLYKEGMGPNLIRSLLFTKDKNGTWLAHLDGDFLNKYYTVQAMINGKWSNEVTDPYAPSVGVNGNRVQIIDFSATNPTGWSTDVSPAFTKDQSMQDAVIYEMHIRDISMHASSGFSQKGKFSSLTESNTKNPFGESTGLQHMKELGVTHVHLLPVFDFNYTDETKLDQPFYNWGYGPKNYNTPEGSYSTNPYDAHVRIKEFKEMVASFHKNGLRVVMDVVYNHTAQTKESNFHQLVPGYYYRMKKDGTFCDASACGNETASEQPMMRKFMIETLVHWVKEYHVDGFRFDLMAIHDIETMNQIEAALKAIKPDILIYGEGWAASPPAMEESKMAFKRYVSKLNNIAVFSDDIRDGIKGYVFEEKAKGFVNGNPKMTETIKFGIVGSMLHPQVNMTKAFYDKVPYASKPAQVINYVDCHDNLALWDKLAVSADDATEEQRIRMQEMAYGIVLTSQGIPFIHAGSEFLRTKYGIENSYNKPDSINAINWNLKHSHYETYRFIQQLIQIRKEHLLFRLRTAGQVANQLKFLSVPDGVVAYTIERKTEADTWKKVLVICNALKTNYELNLPEGSWRIAVSNAKDQQLNSTLTAAPLSFTVLYQE